MSTTGQNRRRMAEVTERVARAIADAACTQAPIAGCRLTSGSAVSTECHTDPWTRRASITTSGEDAHVVGVARSFGALTSTQSAHLVSDWPTIDAVDGGIA